MNPARKILMNLPGKNIESQYLAKKLSYSIILITTEAEKYEIPEQHRDKDEIICEGENCPKIYIAGASSKSRNELKVVENVFSQAKSSEKIDIVEKMERMIKDKFPGIRRDFARAYEQLHDRDLFELAGKDLSEMSLLDRLNLEFKLGLFGHIQVPFDANEQQYVTRMANTETFEDVVQLSKELYDLWNDEQEAQDFQIKQIVSPSRHCNRTKLCHRGFW